MKILTVILMILLPVNQLFVQQEDMSIIEDIAAVITAADASKLAGYLNETVDITLPDNEGTYSKSQAELIMKDFFSKFPPDTFNINHQGSSQKGSLYAIGTYTTSALSYRNYMLLKSISGELKITQFRLEED